MSSRLRLRSWRFTIRALLIASFAFAVVLAWGVANYRAWQAERAAIERLSTFSYGRVSEVSQDLLDQIPGGGFRCGAVPPGLCITHDSTLPNFLAPIERRLGIKFFQRVTEISSYREHDPAIVHELVSFGELRTIAFAYSPAPPHQRTPAESEFLGAIKLFAHMNPERDVSWPDDPSPVSPNAWANANRDPFGDGDPFTVTADSSHGSDSFDSTDATEP